MTLIQRITVLFLFLSLVSHSQNIAKPEGNLFDFLFENPFEIVPETKTPVFKKYSKTNIFLQKNRFNIK